MVRIVEKVSEQSLAEYIRNVFFEPQEMNDTGFRVISFDFSDQHLTVVRFHDQFAGRHDGPLLARNARIHAQILMDTSSVEVFGDNGRTVVRELPTNY